MSEHEAIYVLKQWLVPMWVWAAATVGRTLWVIYAEEREWRFHRKWGRWQEHGDMGETAVRIDGGQR